MTTDKDISPAVIAGVIKFIRGQKVMLDRDLAELYGVQTKTLVQAVKRNRERFPADFMFQLSAEELEHWRSQFVTFNSSAKMRLRLRPYAFTGQRVFSLTPRFCSALHSPEKVYFSFDEQRTHALCKVFPNHLYLSTPSLC